MTDRGRHNFLQFGPLAEICVFSIGITTDSAFLIAGEANVKMSTLTARDVVYQAADGKNHTTMAC